MRTYKVVSGDGHLEFPADMWVGRVPAKHRDMAPRAIIKDNTQYWQMGEFEHPCVGNLRAGLRSDAMVQEALRYRNEHGELRPGCGGGAQRLREQDADGLDAEVLFPPVYGPNFLRNLIEKNKDAYVAILQAYNSYVAEEYCAVARDRLIGTFLVPETGVDDAIAEVARCKKMGLNAVCLNMWPNGGTSYMPEDDRFFAALLDMDVKLAPHINFGTRGFVVTRSTGDALLSFGGLIQGAAHTIGHMIMHGVFDRFPALRVYFAETQCSWLAGSLKLIDDFYLRWYPYYKVLHLKKMPSDYYRDHCKFGFISDPACVHARYQIGVDMMLWGTDLPHGVADYPDSVDVVEDMFAGIPEDEKKQMILGNVCEFFDLDPSKPLTETPKGN